MLLFIYTIAYFISGSVSIWFLIILFRSKNKSPIGQATVQLCVLTAAWFLVDFFTLLDNSVDANFSLFFWRLSLLASSTLLIYLLKFIFVYLNKKPTKFFKWFFYILYILLAYFILFSDKIVRDLSVYKFTGNSNFVGGDYFVYWAMLMLVLLCLVFYLLLQRVRISKDSKEKKFLNFFVLTLGASFSIIAISNLILPIMGIDFPRLAFLGILSILLSIIYIIYRWGAFSFEISSFNIRFKIIVTMVLISLIPTITISTYFYGRVSNILESEQLIKESKDLQAKKNQLDSFLNISKEDILFLSQSANLKNFINSQDDEAKINYKKNLTNNLLNFSRQRKIYYQIRYLDETGQEIVRIDNNNGNAFVVPEDKLQNKAGRYYFDDTMNTEPGLIFVSPLDLNIENGQIEEPYKPVIRYGTPVFDNQGNPKGVVLINVDAKPLLKVVRSDNDDIKKEYLIDKDGYFLVHPEVALEWGFMFDKPENNINIIYPTISQNIYNSKKQEDQFFCPVENCYISYELIYPSGSHNTMAGNISNTNNIISQVQGDDYYWVLFSKIDKAALSYKFNNTLFYVYWIFFIILILVIIFSLLLSNLIARPIQKLRRGVKIIKDGNLNYKVEIDSKDELAELADSFNEMTGAIKESRAEVDKRVKDQTKEIVTKSEDLEKQQLAILNILEDVEEDKVKTELLAKDLEKFKLAVENASDHVVITDDKGIILYANDAVEKITGFSRKEILGKKVGTKDNWGGQMDKEFYRKLWHTILEKKDNFSGDVKNKRKDGEIYESAASISPILDEHGHVKFFVGIERDITKEKQIDRAKSEFVSLASHQLRTPLSTINWYAEMLLAGDAGKLNKEQRDYLEEVYKGNQRMVDLVNALLNVSRIELGTLAVDPKPTNLIDQAESVLNEIKPLIAKKKLRVIKKFAKNIPEINLDDKLMRIVWQNLLSNSLKYTPEKGKIGVVISKDKTNVKIEVSDTGMGIPKYQQKNIFTKLFRADNVREHETDGTGLGLYIVKSVIEQFGGKVWFKSVENKGTTFYATIPLKGIKAKQGTKGLEYTK